MISGLIGASYNTVVTLTTKGAKKVTNRIVETDLLEDTEPTVEEIIEEAPTKAVNAHQKKIRALMIYAGAFILASIITVGSSWLVANAATKANTGTSVIKVVEQQSLSDEDIEDITDRAAEKVDPGETIIEKETEHEVEKETIKEKTAIEELDFDVETFKAEHQHLQERLEEIESLLSKLPSSEVSQTDLLSLQDSLESLKTQLNQLEQRISELETTPPSSAEIEPLP